MTNEEIENKNAGGLARILKGETDATDEQKDFAAEIVKRDYLMPWERLFDWI